MATKILSRGASSHSEHGGDPLNPPDRDTQSASLQLGRAITIAVVAAAIVSLILLAFSWPSVTSDPEDLPVAAVGDQEQIDQITDNAPEGMLEVHRVDSRQEAVQLIREREVYRAFVVDDDNPEILTAEAAWPLVAQQLSTIGSTMQKQIDDQVISGLQEGTEKMQKQMEKAVTAAAAGQAPPQGDDAGLDDGADASAAEVPQVKVTEVVPLSDDDPSGAGLAIAGLPLTIGGIVGGVLTSMGIRSRRMRAVGTLVYGAIGGLALALIMQTWFDILQGDFGLNVLAIGLSIAATAGLINGFVSLIGPAGIGI